LIRVDCEEASVGLFGVLETQVWALLGRELEGVGILSRMSSWEIIVSGLMEQVQYLENLLGCFQVVKRLGKLCRMRERSPLW